MATQMGRKRKVSADFSLLREIVDDGYSGVEVRVTPMRKEIMIKATRSYVGYAVIGLAMVTWGLLWKVVPKVVRFLQATCSESEQSARSMKFKDKYMIHVENHQNHSLGGSG
ncbi:uncharacterized protein LOC114721549 isoform X2 [Neltuma alba]|uniref:uncharacterized protein LOC114721549 isoform X2 n=1 Tax=Neltuma alba TaxID=207710 RepID=UPI0010A5307D|nr:uncharacterized protein LOC114721549 isoform X2 [Prosopis alba]